MKDDIQNETSAMESDAVITAEKGFLALRLNAKGHLIGLPIIAWRIDASGSVKAITTHGRAYCNALELPDGRVCTRELWFESREDFLEHWDAAAADAALAATRESLLRAV